ncbi:MAG TPA: acyl-CoA dehydrogenase family protein, partial [Streptomyces sp.]|nr:acyl-CoA dehydrogenase family protein [Streptomyces sp.]
MTDLLYSEEEDALRAALRGLLTGHCEPAGVLARAETDTPHDPALWTLLTDGMGLAGLLVPEDLGGQGASHREAAVVLEELGRSVAPVPYLTSAVVATEALLASGGADLLGALASGRRVAALAVGLHVAPGGPLTAVRVTDGTLHGELTGIADAAVADVLLVPADDGGLYAVESGAATVTPQVSLDLTRPVATVTLDGTPGRRLGDAAPAVRRALRAGAGLLASEQLGLAEWALAETVRHVKERKQFNRPVGGFQALKHRLA